MALMTDFDEDGFAWTTGHDWRGLGRNNHSLLIDDNENSDQVLITDMPSNDNTNGNRHYSAINRMSSE